MTLDLLRFTTAGSVDDGKSTLIGRLLYDSKQVFDDQLEHVAEVSRQRGGEGVLDLALLTDGLRAEREQGITIDVAYRYFASDGSASGGPGRRFIIADVPGHKQYTRNMVTGASTADLSIVLLDARRGAVEQSKRHAYISALLGIPHIVACVNKMDLVDWDEGAFRRIAAEFVEFCQRLNVADVVCIPISALHGDNVVEISQNMPWYHGPTLLSHLETVEVAYDHPEAVPARFPVQWVIRTGASSAAEESFATRESTAAADLRAIAGAAGGSRTTATSPAQSAPAGKSEAAGESAGGSDTTGGSDAASGSAAGDSMAGIAAAHELAVGASSNGHGPARAASTPEYRGYAGQIASGVLHTGDEVTILPAGQRTHIAAIDTFDGPLEEAAAPLSVTLRLADEIDVSRGDLICHPDSLPQVGRELFATVCWMTERPLRAGDRLLLKHMTRTVQAIIETVHDRVEVETLGREAHVSELELNDVGHVTLRTSAPLAFDLYRDSRSTGGFILIDEATNGTVAAGMIEAPLTS